MEYLNDEQAIFFTWCDEALRKNVPTKGMSLSQWHPRKNREGKYELVLELNKPEGEPLRKLVDIPKQFHDLLEREYFICHPYDEEDMETGSNNS